MSLIHEALKKAARDETLQALPSEPRKIHISTGTFPIVRLILFSGLLFILLSVVTFIYLKRVGSGSTVKSVNIGIPASPLREEVGQPDVAGGAAGIRMKEEASVETGMQVQEETTTARQVSLHLQQGMNDYKAGKPAEAEQEYRRALSLRENDAVIHNNLGLALKAQGKFKEAEAHYQSALKLRPDYVPSLNNLGLLYDEQNRVEDAIRLYQRALQLAPEYAAAHLNYALALERTGYQNEARLHYQAFLAHASHEDRRAVSLVKKHLQNRE
jgi:tetratricopeptide (TPR) repeat protein